MKLSVKFGLLISAVLCAAYHLDRSIAQTSSRAVVDEISFEDVGELPITMTGGNFKLQFITKDSGWLSNEKTLWRTEDGGKSWALIQEFKEHFTFSFLNKDLGWRYTPHAVDKTTDGGRSWISVTLPKGTRLDSISGMTFTIDGEGWLSGVVFRPVTSEQASNLRSGQLSGDETHAISGVIFHTKDWGESWVNEAISSPLGVVLQAVLVEQKRRWVLGGYDVFYEEDGAWRSIDFRQCVGGNKEILQAVEVGDWQHDFYGPTDINFINDRIGWIAFENGLFAKSSDGGDTWCDAGSLKVGQSKAALDNKLHFVDADRGISVLNGKAVYLTVDGGTSWTKLDPPWSINKVAIAGDTLWLVSGLRLHKARFGPQK